MHRAKTSSPFQAVSSNRPWVVNQGRWDSRREGNYLPGHEQWIWPFNWLPIPKKIHARTRVTLIGGVLFTRRYFSFFRCVRNKFFVTCNEQILWLLLSFLTAVEARVFSAAQRVMEIHYFFYRITLVRLSVPQFPAVFTIMFAYFLRATSQKILSSLTHFDICLVWLIMF